MSDLTELDMLVRIWRQYVDEHADDRDQFGRAAGYLSGLRTCAKQLAETLERVRADA